MGLETGTYIDSLIVTNPVATDDIQEGDNHIRLLKSTIKNTFPNLTGAVTATHTELNHIDGVTSNVQTQLDDKANIVSGGTEDNIVTLDANGNIQDGGSPISNLGATKSVIINGAFDVWQRGISQTSNGYGSDDRWLNGHMGSTKTHSQQAFTLGQTDVPHNPKYYSRTIVNSITGADNYVLKYQNIEGVRTFAGQTATLSFYAKADANRNMTTEFYQSFGSGGSPSANVPAIGVQKHSLTTSWQKYTVTVAIPSIVGKTIGTDNNDFLSFAFWFDAGSNLNSRTDSLGHQSGTFDIAQVQLEAGSQATSFQSRSYGEELALCQRYFYRIENYLGYAPPYNAEATGANGSSGGSTITFRVNSIHPVEMRATPTFAYQNVAIWDGNQVNVTGIYNNNSSKYVRSLDYNLSGSLQAAGNIAIEFLMPSGFIECDAEL